MRRRKGDSPRMPRAAPRQVGSPAPVGNGGPERQRPGDGGVPPAGGGGAASESGRRTPPMLIAAKVLGATCLAGALATTGVLTTDSFAHHDPAGPATTTLVSDPHATFQALAVGDEAEVPAGDAGSRAGDRHGAR